MNPHRAFLLVAAPALGLDGYAGYGQALTGDAWYRHFWRAELRLIF
jgi:hypothetical protein